MHFIYKITNQINGKIYIGQTCNPTRRWLEHVKLSKNSAKYGSYIHRAMSKDSVENFSFEIIASCRTLDDSNEIESFIINQYGSLDSAIGYNLTTKAAYGGHSNEVKEKIKQATYKQIKENGHPGLGYKKSYEQIEKSKIYLNSKESMAKRIATNNEKILVKFNAGEFKCNALGCESNDPKNQNFVNGIRYCDKHANRLRKTGHLEFNPAGRFIKGQDGHNKKQFTDEEISEILSDKRNAIDIGKEFCVSSTVIYRIREENATKPLIYENSKKEFSEEEIKNILTDNRSAKILCKDYGVSEGPIRRIRKEYNRKAKSTGLKIELTQEKISNIISDKRSYREIAETYNVSTTVIVRVFKENGIFSKKNPCIEFTNEQISLILNSNKSIKDLSAEFNVSPKVINRILRENNKLRPKQKGMNDFTKDEIEKIVQDTKSSSDVAIDFSVSPALIWKIRNANGDERPRYWNKKEFTEEQINFILTSNKGNRSVGEEFGVTHSVIKRIREEYGYQKPEPKYKQFSNEQILAICKDPRGA